MNNKENIKDYLEDNSKEQPMIMKKEFDRKMISFLVPENLQGFEFIRDNKERLKKHNNKILVTSLEHNLKLEYAKTNSILFSEIKSQSIIKPFKKNFGSTVNPRLMDLKLWKAKDEYYIVSFYSEPGNSHWNKNDLTASNGLNHLKEVDDSTTFSELGDLLFKKLDFEDYIILNIGRSDLFDIKKMNPDDFPSIPEKEMIHEIYFFRG